MDPKRDDSLAACCTPRARSGTLHLALLPLLLVGLACGGARTGANVPGTGAPYSDARLLAVLRPGVAVQRDGLWEDHAVGVWYEALLDADPPTDFGDQYLVSLRSRGVFVQAQPNSPHAIFSRVDGFEVVVVQRGSAPIYSVEYVTFGRRRAVSDSTGLSTRDFRDIAGPVRVTGRQLTFLLGRRASPWTARIVVPTRDLLTPPELPFPRYPGALLVSANVALGESRGRSSIDRHYVLRGGAWDGVARHYERALAALGLNDIRTSSASPLVFWSGDSALGLLRVAIGPTQATLVPESGLNISEMRSTAPRLLEGLPDDALFFNVSVDFSSPSAATRYGGQP